MWQILWNCWTVSRLFRVCIWKGQWSIWFRWINLKSRVVLVLINCRRLLWRNVLVWPILHEKSMELGKISIKLKLSRVVPVYKKKEDKWNVKNYRIIAISSVIMRIYESATQSKLLGIVNRLILVLGHSDQDQQIWGTCQLWPLMHFQTNSN